MIEISGLYKAFGRQQVLRGIDLDIPVDAITAVIGPNGSGKTTLMKSILRMVIPDSGKIRVMEAAVNGNCDYRKDIGYLPQIARFPENLTFYELLRMVRDLRKQYPDETGLIRMFQLEPFLKKRLRYLSGGTRQKINVVLAFLFGSRILILDEPTAGLDPLAVIQLKELIRQHRSLGKAIIITTHSLPLVEEMADRVVFLMEGRIYFNGTMDQLRALYNQESLEKAISAILLQKEDV